MFYKVSDNDWENLQQSTKRVVIEMSSKSDFRQDWENVQQPTERVVIEISSQTDPVVSHILYQ